MVIIDSDVLLLAFAYHRDERQTDNAAFLTQVQNANPATTVYNLMEVLAQLSFNLSPARLAEWESWLIEPYHLTVIWPRAKENQTAEAFFRAEIFEHPFTKAREHRVAFLDALVIGLAERTPDVESLVTWNARHFKDKTTLRVQTPSEYLAM
jgi:hypothetical protein